MIVHKRRYLSLTLLMLSLMLCFWMFGCEGEGQGEGNLTYTPGAADVDNGAIGFQERGPLDFTAETLLNFDAGTIPSFRVYSNGTKEIGGVIEATTIEINLTALDDETPRLIIEGPLSDIDQTPLTAVRLDNGEWRPEGSMHHVVVRLEQPGIYRIFATTHSVERSDGTVGFSDGILDGNHMMYIEGQCLENCARPSVPISVYADLLDRSGKLPILLEAIRSGLDQMIVARTAASEVEAQMLRTKLMADLEDIVERKAWDELTRFLMIDFNQMALIRPLMAPQEGEETAFQSYEPVEGNLLQLLGACVDNRTDPAEVNPVELPGLTRGHFPNHAFTACQVAHSTALADVMTRMGANPSTSNVTYKGQRIESLKSLFEALSATGHIIEVRNEKMYADFLGLAFMDESGQIAGVATNIEIVWPVWINTGADLGGQPLTIPAGHSQVVWSITGPEINAQIRFFHGINGVAFFPALSVRPPWTGYTVSHSASTGNRMLRDGVILGADNAEPLLVNPDVASVMSSIEGSELMLRRILEEAETEAAEMSAHGYGYLGACNDSVAAVELFTWNTTTIYPLVRAAELDSPTRQQIDDGLDPILMALPNDSDNPPSADDVFRRSWEMTPFQDLSSPLIIDEFLRNQLVTLSGEVAAE